MFHTETLSCKASTNLTFDVLPRLKFLSAITAFQPLTVFLIKSFTTNKIYPDEAHSGFECESPIHIRTWTWNASNNGQGSL